jgi:tetratricopeptide (TPR) repeat protein
VAQVNSPSLPFALTGSNSTSFNQSDQLFSRATGLMFNGENKAAFTVFAKAAKSFKSEKRYHEWSGCYAGIAIVLSSEGRYRKFLRLSKQALRLHNKFNRHDLDAGETLRSNVGMGYVLLGKRSKAKEFWPAMSAIK